MAPHLPVLPLRIDCYCDLLLYFSLIVRAWPSSMRARTPTPSRCNIHRLGHFHPHTFTLILQLVLHLLCIFTVQSKYVGTGHADTTKHEWLVNQHRDTTASIIGCAIPHNFALKIFSHSVFTSPLMVMKRGDD